jgi:hypothetical protein
MARVAQQCRSTPYPFRGPIRAGDRPRAFPCSDPHNRNLRPTRFSSMQRLPDPFAAACIPGPRS